MDKKIKSIKILGDIYHETNWYSVSNSEIIVNVDPEDEFPHQLRYRGGSEYSWFGLGSIDFWQSCGRIEIVYEEEVKEEKRPELPKKRIDSPSVESENGIFIHNLSVRVNSLIDCVAHLYKKLEEKE